LQIDVFTLVPHSFAWLCEQRPLAAVLGGELDLRLLNYRDYSPLRAGQVDDEPYGGGAGMVLRVDVAAAALEAVYGRQLDQRVVALTPQGRQLDQALVQELAGEERLTLLSARFEGFDERIVANLASDAISIGPYVLSNGDLPAMVLVDAVVRLLPGALGSTESNVHESFSAELERGVEYPHYTRPAEFRGWSVPEILRSGDHARVARWRRAQALRRTLERRPDLVVARGGIDDSERKLLAEFGLDGGDVEPPAGLD
jgi:tRNA (guanine37-N1)-methyltransferase